MEPGLYVIRWRLLSKRASADLRFLVAHVPDLPVSLMEDNEEPRDTSFKQVRSLNITISLQVS